MTRHLFVDISSHGFGHLAQVAPVLNTLGQRCRDVPVTVRSGLPETLLRRRIELPFTHVAASSDFGFEMIDATRIDHSATASRYRDFHADWETRVAREADCLREAEAGLVLTDVAYLPLAGAARAGIPAWSMCSLNWADLFAHFFGNEPWAPPIHKEILAAYRSATGFFRITPSMPMPDLPNTQAVPPIAATGRRLGDMLRTRLACNPADKIVLIAYGGIGHQLDVPAWLVTPGVHWLVPSVWNTRRPDMTALESLDLSFTDLLASVDAVLTKPGYGTFAEAACNGTPVLYQRREDWPEQEALIAWLKTNARCCEIDTALLAGGQFSEVLARLWRQEAPTPPHAGGADEVADRLIQALTTDNRTGEATHPFRTAATP